jgi:signal transduction histidine kinase
MDHLIAAAIHDAKNALGTLGACLDRARGSNDSPDLRQASDLAARVNAQLVELLALHRAGEGSLRLAVADHNLADFFTDLETELRDEKERHPTVTLSLTCAPEAIEWAFDAYLVKFVLLDAVRNALRHAATRVALDCRLEPGAGLHFCITDDGPGFPASVLRGEVGAMDADSSGLGLVFARAIAERHLIPGGRHGRVELHNDGGARFSLLLP